VKVHCDEGVVTHIGPEPCVGIREDAGEASAGVRRQAPEVGAVCVNSARTDLCGGRSVMGVPTAIRAVEGPGASLMVNVFVFTPFALGLLLWFCLLPEAGFAAQELSRRPAANPGGDDREK
jgi:hypothetical protein